MNVVAISGPSGAGKTTAIVALISHLVATGTRIAAIKHTHHQLNDEDRGDTAQFRRAGAEPVVLAGTGDAVVFSGGATRRVKYTDPRDLLALIEADIVFIEGFKSVDAWPRIALGADERRSTGELLEILDRIWRP